jgi:aspartate oxidase
VIRETVWRSAGIVRKAQSLGDGIASLSRMRDAWAPSAAAAVEQVETANLLTVALLVLESALHRRESRGAHFRSDFPERADGTFGFHSWIRSGSPVRFCSSIVF